MTYRPFKCDEKQPEEEEEDICNLKDECKQDKKEKILLLEFLVDTLEIDHHIINSQPELKSGRTIVEFSFLNLPPLQFNEDSLPVGRFKRPCDFKNGKSCLFSVPDFPSIPQDILEVNILVIRELCPGIIPNKMPIAKTTVDLTTVYQTLIKESRAHPYCLPISRSYKECYLLTNLTGTRIAGSIGVFIRASCFGKIIVSQFHMGSQECLFQGSPQVHPIMYQYQSIAAQPEDMKDVLSEEDVSKPEGDAEAGPTQEPQPPAAGEEKPFDMAALLQPPGADGAEAVRKSLPGGAKPGQGPQEAGPAQDAPPGKGADRRSKGPTEVFNPALRTVIPAKKPPCPQDESEGTPICPEACGFVCPEAEPEICPPGGPVINLMDAGPGESFYVERGFCQCEKGAVCVCDKLPQFTGSKAHKVKELETEVCGHALSVRIPKSPEETNWYELDFNRLFNDDVPCECRGIQTEPPCKDYDGSDEEDIPPICGGKPCGGVCESRDRISRDKKKKEKKNRDRKSKSGVSMDKSDTPICKGKPCGVCASGDKLDREESDIPPICGGKPCGGVCTEVYNRGKPKTLIPGKWIPPELIPHFSSIKEYVGRSDIQVKTPFDPEHDIFVLKISKKGEPPEAKPQLELELRTPKRPIPGPVTRLTQEIQYDPADFGGGGGGGGGKGKGKGKGKEKGKGKKKK